MFVLARVLFFCIGISYVFCMDTSDDVMAQQVSQMHLHGDNITKTLQLYNFLNERDIAIGISKIQAAQTELDTHLGTWLREKPSQVIQDFYQQLTTQVTDWIRHLSGKEPLTKNFVLAVDTQLAALNGKILEAFGFKHDPELVRLGIAKEMPAIFHSIQKAMYDLKSALKIYTRYYLEKDESPQEVLTRFIKYQPLACDKKIFEAVGNELVACKSFEKDKTFEVFQALAVVLTVQDNWERFFVYGQKFLENSALINIQNVFPVLNTLASVFSQLLHQHLEYAVQICNGFSTRETNTILSALPNVAVEDLEKFSSLVKELWENPTWAIRPEGHFDWEKAQIFLALADTDAYENFSERATQVIDRMPLLPIFTTKVDVISAVARVGALQFPFFIKKIEERQEKDFNRFVEQLYAQRVQTKALVEFIPGLDLIVATESVLTVGKVLFEEFLAQLQRDQITLLEQPGLSVEIIAKGFAALRPNVERLLKYNIVGAVALNVVSTMPNVEEFLDQFEQQFKLSKSDANAFLKESQGRFMLRSKLQTLLKWDATKISLIDQLVDQHMEDFERWFSEIKKIDIERMAFAGQVSVLFR